MSTTLHVNKLRCQLIAGLLLLLAVPAAARSPYNLVPPAAAANGVTLSGLELGGTLPGVANTDYAVPNAAEITYYVSRGMTIARIPFSWERLQPVLGRPFNATYLGYIQYLVKLLAQHNVRAMLDLHNYGNRCTTITGASCTAQAVVGSAAVPEANFVQFWTLMATTFKNSPNVDFDLMNEPYTITPANWAGYVNDAIAAIRAQGFTGAIYVEGAGTYSSATAFVSSGWAALATTITDPLNLVVFSLHDYMDSDRSGTHATCVTGDGSNDLVAATAYANAHHLTLQLGEIGFSNDSSCRAENAAILSYLAANQNVWLGVTLWGAGPWWGQGYYYNLDPASLVAPYTDLPQMGAYWTWLQALPQN
ncbi:MAG TPA: glycoside hydrolase family 5 protein [Acidocella sp.]|nr:glycoside hydrolase family 5 protein [Acidocella sp.]